MTIAMLSWGAERTLRNTLDSYAFHRFPNNEQKIIVLQEGTPEQEAMVRAYGFEPIRLSMNVGIARAYRILLEAADEDTFLFLENDWQLISNPYPQISVARTALVNADVVRLRHRNNPGAPLWSRQFQGHEMQRPEYLLDSVHWRDRPDIDFAGQISSEVRHWMVMPDVPNVTEGNINLPSMDTIDIRVFYASSRYANWTNNPHLAFTDFLRQNIAPRLGEEDIERDMQDWWRQQDFIVAQSDGLFTHNRLD